MVSPDGKKRRNRLWGYGPIVLFAVLAVAYSLYWIIARAIIDREIETWIETQRAEGATVSFSRKRVHGFPYRFALTLEDPVYASPEAELTWRGEKLQLAIQPWNYNHVIVRTPGRNEITSLRGDAAIADIKGRSALSVRLRDGAPYRIALVLDDAGIETPEGRFLIDDFALRLAPAEDAPATLRLAIDLAEAHLPRAPDNASWLGRDVGASRLRLRLLQMVPALETERPLQTWQAQGGALQLDQLILNYGPVNFGGKGTLTPNPKGQLDGTLSVRLDNLDALSAALEEAGALTDELRSVLALLAGFFADGQFLDIPVQDGKGVFLGQNIFSLPPLTSATGS